MDKAPDFGLPFFYRVLVPGTAVTVAALPLWSMLLSALGIAGKDQAPYVAGISVFTGFMLSLLDDPIYQVLEGRRGWPKWLASWRQRRWRSFVESKYKLQETLAEDSAEYAECWYLLRQFPVDHEGNPMVTRPSRIGNVIASYEDYAYLRYGMNDTFYWPRLWLILDKETRSEIDNPWSAVDSILYTGVGASIVGTAYLALAAISTVAGFFGRGGPLGVQQRPIAAIVGIVLLTFCILCQRISIPGLVRNGERYQSVFDLFRSKLDLRMPSDSEKDEWRNLAIRLLYGADYIRSPAKPKTKTQPSTSDSTNPESPASGDASEHSDTETL